MKKKWLLGILSTFCIATCALGFTACGGGEKGDKGDTGADGKSAYEIWLDNGNTGTETDFLNWLKGAQGDDGDSAYEIWLDNGNTGTEADFLEWLRGESAEEEGTQGLHYQRISGKEEYRVIGLGLAAELDIVIPATYNGLPVTEIGDNAFQDCSYIESVAIPDSVTSIGNGAFSRCTSLTEIVIPNSVTNIGKSVFYGCTSLQYTIENNCKYLGNNANPYLYLAGVVDADVVAATINNQCKWIGTSAFSSCEDLMEIVIPDSVEGISFGAFENNSVLTIYCEVASQPIEWDSDWNNYYSPVVWDCNNNDVAADGNIYTVIDGIRYTIKDGEAAVTTQSINILSATIPASITYKTTSYNVTSIIGGAFSFCEKLTSVTIGENVERLMFNSFVYCYSLSTITFMDTSTWYRTRNQTDWQNKTDGTEIDVTSSSDNASFFKNYESYSDCYFYKI